MKNLIYLFTAHHTGTHFVRMLLETHPEISVCIDLARRVSTDLTPGYVTANRALPPRYDPSELALGDVFLKVCQSMDTNYFRQYLDCYMTGYTMDAVGIASHSDNKVELTEDRRREFREDYGIEILQKHPQYYFVHGHCDLGYMDVKIPKEIRVVTAIRHPLMAVLSSLKRGETDTIPHQMFAFRYLQEMQDIFKFCVDLWSGKPSELLQIFDWLGLAPSGASIEFACRSPRVNPTIGPNERKPHHNYDFRRNLDPVLDEAQIMLASGKLHDILRPYWHELRKTGLVAKYEQLGYDFKGLGNSG